MRWQHFVGGQDHRLVRPEGRRRTLATLQVPEDKTDDAAQVRYALLEVLIPDLRKLALVPLQDVLQGGPRVQAMVSDGQLNLISQRRVRKHLAMSMKDGGVVLLT